ncbi:MAG: histidinol-phosphatase [Chloroflexi bacterium]|nr:histidinol-phosphatase [Chloroflexota bacterium]
MANRECALEIFTVASLLEARGANPYRVRAYRRAALRLLRMREDASVYLNEDGELALPGLGVRLRRKLGELVRTGKLGFHDELLEGEPRAVRTLMTIPGIGPKTADRLIGEARVRGLKSLVRAARRGRLHRMAGVGETREQAWSATAETMLSAMAAAREARRRGRADRLTGRHVGAEAGGHPGSQGEQLPLPLTVSERESGGAAVTAPEVAAPTASPTRAA